MSGSEERDWKRFFMIRGPTGDERLDANFAYLRHVIFASQTGNPPPIDDLTLKFDYRKHFRKGDFAEVEKMVDNVEADIAVIMALGARLRRQTADSSSK